MNTERRAGDARGRLERLSSRKPEMIKLAKMVCLAVQVEPELLRKARLELLPGVSAGVEADLWFSPLVKSRGPNAIVMEPGMNALLRQDLAREPALLERAWGVVRSVHQGIPPALQLEEELIWLSLTRQPGVEQRIQSRLQSVLAALVDPDRQGLAQWALRALPNLPERARQTPEAGLLADHAVRITNLPVESLPLVTASIRLVARGLEVGGPSLEGAHRIELPRTVPLILEVEWQTVDGLPRREQLRWSPGSIQYIETGPGPVTVSTVRGDTYRLTPLQTVSDREEYQPDIPAILSEVGLDYSGLMDEKTRDFTGREWLFDEVERWILDPLAQPVLLLTGEPGSGKSSFAAQYVKTRSPAAYHFCVPAQSASLDPHIFVRSLATQLALRDIFSPDDAEFQGPDIQEDEYLRLVEYFSNPDVSAEYQEELSEAAKGYEGLPEFDCPPAELIIPDPESMDKIHTLHRSFHEMFPNFDNPIKLRYFVVYLRGQVDQWRQGLQEDRVRRERDLRNMGKSWIRHESTCKALQQLARVSLPMLESEQSKLTAFLELVDRRQGFSTGKPDDAPLPNQSNIGPTGGEIPELPGTAFSRLIVNPLERAAGHHPFTNYCIVVDAVDEASRDVQISILDLLADLVLAKNMRLLITSRPTPEVLDRFPTDRARRISLEENEWAQADLIAYLTPRLEQIWKEHPLEDLTPQTAAERIAQFARGNFMYAATILHNIGQNTMPWAQLKDLPHTLNEFFLASFNRIFSSLRVPFDETVRPVLSVLVAAQEPLTPDQISKFTGRSVPMVRESLEILRPFFSSTTSQGEEFYSLYHQSLGSFLLDSSLSERYRINEHTAHSLITEFYWNQYQGRWEECDPYGLTFLPVHLNAAREPGRVRILLLDLSWLKTRLKQAGLQALLSDFKFSAPDEGYQETFQKTVQQTVQEPPQKTLPDMPPETLQMPSLRRLQIVLEEAGPILNNEQDRLPELILERLAADDDPALAQLLEQARMAVQPEASTPPPSSGIWLRHYAGASQEDTRRQGPVTALTISASGRYAVSGWADGTTMLWDMEKGEALRTFVGQRGIIRLSAVLPDERRMISGDEDGMFKLWDIETGKEIMMVFDPAGPISSAAVTPEGLRFLSAGSSSAITLWELESGKPLGRLEGFRGTVQALSLSPDGQWMVSGTDDGIVRVWDLKSAHQLRTLTGHEDAVNCLLISPEGRTVVSGSGDRTVRFWDLESGRELAVNTGHEGAVRTLAMLPDGLRVISGGDDYTLRVWEVESRSHTTIYDAGEHITQCAVSPDGKILVLGVESGGVSFFYIESNRASTMA